MSRTILTIQCKFFAILVSLIFLEITSSASQTCLSPKIIDRVFFFQRSSNAYVCDRETGSKVLEVFYDTSPRSGGEAVTMHAFYTWTSSSRCPTSLDSDLRRRSLLSPASAFPQRQRQCRPLVPHWFPTLAIVRTHRDAVLFSISFLAELFCRDAGLSYSE